VATQNKQLNRIQNSCAILKRLVEAFESWRKNMKWRAKGIIAQKPFDHQRVKMVL
jgi:hypothetical protein